MLGREAYDNPMILLDLEKIRSIKQPNINRIDILEKYLEYVDNKLTDGFNLAVMLKHLFQLNKGLKIQNYLKKLSTKQLKMVTLLNYLINQKKF